MDRALKAALISGLVFPGGGQIFLKRYRRGIILIAPVVMGLVIIMALAVSTAITLVNQLDLEEGMPDMKTILSVAHESTPSNSTYYQWCLFIIAGCWLYSIVDAYNLGKQCPPPLPPAAAR